MFLEVLFIIYNEHTHRNMLVIVGAQFILQLRLDFVVSLGTYVMADGVRRTGVWTILDYGDLVSTHTARLTLSAWGGSCMHMSYVSVVDSNTFRTHHQIFSRIKY